MTKRRRRKKPKRRQKTFAEKIEAAGYLERNADVLSEHDQEFVRSLLSQLMDKGDLSARQWSWAFRLKQRIRLVRKVKSGLKSPADQWSWLYAIWDGSRVKIGYSKEPDRRLRTLRGASGLNLAIIRKQRFPAAEIKKREGAMRRACREYAIRGEWFGDDCLAAWDKRIEQWRRNGLVPPKPEGRAVNAGGSQKENLVECARDEEPGDSRNECRPAAKGLRVSGEREAASLRSGTQAALTVS